MNLEVLSTYNLVGGTGLSLKLGHRISIDIDLFSKEKIENEVIINCLSETFQNKFVLISSNKVGIFCKINNIKVDLIHYNFDLINPIEEFENLRIVSSEDIAAMKIQAILGRGVKKDFYDLFELLNQFSLNEIIQFHKSKYPLQTLNITIPQAFTYFEEADESEDPISLRNETWDEVKKGLRKVVNDYLK
jgi:predicted nucleotidyltransferase component of viral defense system